MKVNPDIKKTLYAIGNESVKLANTPSEQYKYTRRMMKIYDSSLSDEERIFLWQTVMEMIHYRSIVTDHDNILMIYNMKFRNMMLLFFFAVLTVLLIGVVFKTNEHLNGIVDIFGNLFRMISLGD